MSGVSEWAGATEFRKAMRPRGAAQRLATALDLWPANITRYKRGAEPPEEVLVRIEAELGMTFARGTTQPGGADGELLDRVRRLERAVECLAELAVRGGAQLPADVQDVVRALR